MKKKVRFSINPPPRDLCCEVCGKHVNELEWFDGDYFKNAKLVKTFREFGGCIGASWECKDCIKLASIRGIQRKRYDEGKCDIRI